MKVIYAYDILSRHMREIYVHKFCRSYIQATYAVEICGRYCGRDIQALYEGNIYA